MNETTLLRDVIHVREVAPKVGDGAASRARDEQCAATLNHRHRMAPRRRTQPRSATVRRHRQPLVCCYCPSIARRGTWRRRKLRRAKARVRWPKGRGELAALAVENAGASPILGAGVVLATKTLTSFLRDRIEESKAARTG